MKYLVLAGGNYYPAGASDARFSSDDMLTAVINAKSYLGVTMKDEYGFSTHVDWAEVLDTDTLGVVWSSRDDN